MDFSMEAVANKIILMIVGLSALVVAGGVGFYMLRPVGSTGSVSADAVPFAVGVAVAMCVNVAKILLMKKAVRNAVERGASAAKLYLQGQYFTRLFLTLAVFLAAGWLHAYVQNEAGNPAVVNFIGVAIGIFTLPVAMHLLHFFLKDDIKAQSVDILETSKTSQDDTVQSAIDKLNAIGSDDGQEVE